MSNTTPLSPYPTSDLTRNDVVNYLLQCKANAWCQEAYQVEYPDQFVLVLGEGKEILILPEGSKGTWQIQYRDGGTFRFASHVNQATELETEIRKAAERYGEEWPSHATSARLSAATPATNLSTISKLIGNAEIEAVFDPYLDNAALVALSDILSFGGSISNTVRLLGSTKMPQSDPPRLTRSLVQLWLMQMGIRAGEVRLMQPSEHRRFLLLSGGQALILGPSLNSLAKNEAVHREPDRQDRPFFETVWTTAQPL